jgi:DNA modification methylase
MSIEQQHQQELDLGITEPVKQVTGYKFEPIRGYPMLHWAGKRPFTSTQYYPAQHKETYGPEVDGWRNKIYWGDNLQVMSHLLKEFRGKVKLVYIDPPYDSKADYKRTISIRGKDTQNNQSVFEEKQYSDIWTNDEYLQFMYERVTLLKELLSEDGSIYLHCDFHKGHHLRCILDEIFGEKNFVNEIVWAYTRFARPTPFFPRVHDTILLYQKSGSRKFNANSIRIPYSEETLGRTNRGAGEQGLVGSSNEAEDRHKNRLHGGGKVPEDWWIIPRIQGNGLERLGYPTQKPETILERVIKASTDEGDLVFDCFMGSGTTQAVAMKLGRRFIGADINLGAIQITTKRLLTVASNLSKQPQKLISEDDQIASFYTGFDVYNVNNYDIFRSPIQAKELLIQALEINQLPAGGLFDGEKDGRMVKVMPINRIATRQDLNELITGFDYRAFEKRQAEHPNQAVEKVTLVCMGHEPDLAAHLQHQMSPFKLDIQVVDILRDKQDLQFKRDAEAKIVIRDGYLVIENFYPMNLLNKLSLQQEHVENWRELVDSVMVDWNYDGGVLQPAEIDVPEGNNLVVGRYRVSDDAGTIRVKITDLLSESLEMELVHG